jgi:glutamine amidotransferase
VIAVIDYGMGNLRSVQKAFEHVGAGAVLTSERATIESAEGVLFPGQGCFPDAMRELTRLGLVEVLRDWVRAGRPFLGICLGHQLIFDESEEGGRAQGLGLMPGRVVRFSPGGKVPHMGWNSVRRTDAGRACPLLEGVKDGAYFYFVHSYYPVPGDASVVAATTDYNDTFASVVCRDRFFSTQFHPEKSQEPGLRVLRNFISLL